MKLENTKSTLIELIEIKNNKYFLLKKRTFYAI